MRVGTRNEEGDKEYVHVAGSDLNGMVSGDMRRVGGRVIFAVTRIELTEHGVRITRNGPRWTLEPWARVLWVDGTEGES